MKQIATWIRQVQLVIGFFLLCLIVSGRSAADGGDRSNRTQAEFSAAEVALGMDIEQVLKIYPDAKIERPVANCYSYGRAISIPALTRHILRHHDNNGNLTLGFAPAQAGGKLDRIHYDRPVSLSPAEIRTLIERLSVRYGPYDRILRRRKMEPAGRIVGFEWQRVDGATMRVVLRHDFGHGGNAMRLNVVAKSTVPVPRAKGQTCEKP
ncbi:MAG: hypothetical protein ACRBM6_08945 [Geminicoccales bacterium]